MILKADVLFFSDNIKTCGSVLSSSSGAIVSPDRNNDGLYDMEVDCLWIIVAPENQVIRHKIDQFLIEDASGCRKDVLRVSNIL